MDDLRIFIELSCEEAYGTTTEEEEIDISDFEDEEPYDFDFGFDAYMGCYTYDC